MEKYENIVIVFGTKPSEPDVDGNRWYKAHLVYGPGDKQHISSHSTESPTHAVDLAMSIWQKGHWVETLGDAVHHGIVVPGVDFPNDWPGSMKWVDAKTRIEAEQWEL